MKKILVYKVFKPDWKCRDFQFEIGKTYKLLDKNKKLIEPILCERGFHACKKVQNCFSYYEFNPNNKVAVVELSGTILGLDNDKQCSNIIKIVKELTWNEMLELANTGNGNTGHSNSGDSNSGYRNSGNSNSGNSNSGYSNSGDRNSGNSNSGDRNSGNSNSGYRNSGYSNSGDSNSGDRNSGFFNTTEPKVRIFDVQTELSFDECFNSKWYNLLYGYYSFELTKWISFSNMTDEEKIQYPKAYVCDGYLKTFTYHEAWKNLWDKLSENKVEIIKTIPYFSLEKFEQITGIKID